MTTYRGRPLILAFAAVLCLTGMVLVSATTGEAAKCVFPATGQTTAFTANSFGEPNEVVPDDGTLQKGKPLTYQDNGDGTITDKITGLTWEKKSDDGGLHDLNTTYTWSNADATVATHTIWDFLADINTEDGTGFARHRDWRIPNVKELDSIIDYENHTPAVASVFNTGCTGGATVFTGSCTATDYYWSSTTNATNSASAWLVHFFDGAVVGGDKSTGKWRVRAVRGGC